MATDTLVRRN